MSMLASGKSHIDPNNVPLASLVAQEEHVDVNFIKSNNFNNNAYRNNYGNNNYKPYPPNNGNSYGKSYGNSYVKMPSEERILEIEKATQVFMQNQYEKNKVFTKTMEEQSNMLRNISHQMENLNREISGLQGKMTNAETCISSMFAAKSSLINKMAAKPENIDDNPFATANVIQIQIDENVRLMAQLRARWERERERELEND